MNNTETILFWTTALLLAGGFFLALLSLIFGKARPLAISQALVAAAIATLTALGIVRWVGTGHPPFVSLFESMLASIWFLLVIYQLVRLKVSHTVAVLVPVSGISLLLMGWSSSLPQEASPLSAALENVWLFIHASFATAGAAVFLVGASYSVIYLMGEEKLDEFRRTVPALPGHRDLPKSVVTYLLFGLILWGVMIVSGSIWAHSAWGRYWAWDPVELWSLLSWLIYALLYHARMSLKLSPRVFCILNIVAVATVAFALWGVHYVYETIHTYG
jgi:ABC-type transport system involved in cytochrome c biogenesis permease subunit